MIQTRASAWWLGGIIICGLALAAAFYFDAPVQAWFAGHQTASGRTFMRAVSRFGDGGSHVAVGVIGALIAYLLGNRPWTGIFAAAVLACAMAGALHPVVKVAAGRSRPSVTKDVGWNGLRFGAKYQSFPSGHTISTAAFIGVLVCARRRLGLFLLPIPILIATSRLYLNAHHLSDVVAGAILGAGCSILAWRIVSTRTKFGSDHTRTP